MKKVYLVILLLFCASSTAVFAQVTPMERTAPTTNLVKVDPTKIDPKISAMLNFYDKQINFNENRGQWPDSVLYKADFPLGQALVTSHGMIVGTYDANAYAAHNAQYERKEKAEHDGLKFNEEEVKVPGHGWLMNFVNHSNAMHIEGKSKHNEYYNYFEGKDATKYANNVGSYQEIWYRNVYDNVDVRYYPSATGSLEYDIVCNPGFNKNDIGIQLTGIDKMYLKSNGHLVLQTSVGDMEFPSPVAYQKINGVKTSVEAKYILKNNILTFAVGNYDASQTLIIDPIALRWATWMTNNSTAANHNHCIWVDQNTGYIYVVARVASAGLITVNAIQSTYNGGKTGGDENEIGEYIEPDTIGNPGERVWQTYLGAAGENNPYALEQAANGDLIFTGYTQSSSYPLLGGTQYSGTSINDAASSSSEKIYITKINTSGTSFKSAVIGGNGNDAPFDLRTTSTSDILVCGNTTSTNLATVFPGSGATNSSSSNGQDVIVFRINNDLSAITWMKNYGGTGTDGATIMNTNTTTGDIFVAGTTTSTNFPVTGSETARQTTLGGTESGFIQKLNSSGKIIWSSYFQAASGKSVQILCMELNTTQSSFYFAGLTTGLATTNTSTKVLQPTITGTTDFFVAHMDTNQTFVAATYLGGGNEINMMGLNDDLNNDVYILGYTASTNFPVTSEALQSTNLSNKADNETFTKIRSDLDSLEYSTYYGGSVDDYDPIGERGIKFFNCRIFTIFTSESNNVPLTQGAITTTKLSTSSIYEPGICVWANPPDLANNTITTNQQICKGSEPSGFTGSVPSYVLPKINRDGTISSYPVTINSATTYQWQYSTDSVNWNNVVGGTTQNLSSAQIGPLYQTTYFRRIIGGDACVIAGAAEQTVTVKIMSVSGTVSNVSCFNGNNGSITATPMNGTAPYTYSWNTTPVQTTQTATGLVAGTYRVIVIDATSCHDTMSFNISQPTTALTGTTSSTAATCTSKNGTASVVASGGTGAYTYAWTTSPVQTTATASGLAGGTYTITVTDANGCTFSSSVNVSQSSPMNATASVVTNVSCAGGNNGVATVNTTGGTGTYTYSWNTVPVQTTATATGLTAQTYTVTVMDQNGCNAVSSVTINQPSTSVGASITTQTNVVCYGSATGTATAKASGGTGTYTYSWNTTPAQSSATATGLVAGTYTVTVTDANGCSTTTSATITQPNTAVSASITAQTNVSCFGNNTGSATATATGGTGAYTYSWNTAPVQTSATATGLVAGTYTVTVTDANGCSTTTSATITQPNAAVSASITAQTNVSCFGNNTGSATTTATGGTGAYTYSWNTAPKQTTATATSLVAGTYTVTVTDHNGCSTTAMVIISQPKAAVSASISAQTNVSCFGNNTGSATAKATGGTGAYTYSWNTTPKQTSATATGLAAGTYTVTVTDHNGCSITTSATITQPQAAISASITSQTNVSCFGGAGSATVTATGGTGNYTYSWNTTPIQTAATADNLSSGTYTVTVTDANGCSTTATVVISQPAGALNASVTSQTSVLCFGGNSASATVTATAGTQPYTYSWNTTPVQTTATATGLSSGTYTVTVTDAGGCSTTASVAITQPQATLSASVSSQIPVSCFGSNNGSATASVNGGTPSYTYSWNTTPTQTTATATGLSAGTYTVSITDANGCSTTASATINQPQAALSASVSSQIPVSCFGSNNGSATVSVNGGTPSYTYSWNTNPAQTTATATGLSAGTYTVTVTDTNGCSTTASVNINQPQAALNASVSSQIPVSCFGSNNGSATVSVNGGTPSYTYSWNTTPAQTTATATGLSAGTYTVTITDANGCSTTATVTINQPQAALSASVSSQIPVSCFGSNNGSATVSVNGGTPSYTYSWNTTPAQTTATATGLTAGTYTVTVTDTNGCSTTASVTINQPQAALSASVSSQIRVSCFGNNNGSATVSVNGGTPSYTYSWNTTPAQTTATATGLSAGTYTVTVTDTNGCSTVASVTINQPQAALSASVSSHVNVTCFGGNGSATVTANGGTPSYTYSWNTQPVQTTVTATGLTAGTYTVTVTDTNGCSTVASVTISQPVGALNASITAQANILCYGDNSGTATVTATAGTQPYTYSWNTTPAQITATATGLIAGTYTVTVMDSGGCLTSASVIIAQPQAALSTSVTASSTTVCSSSPTTLTASTSGGTGNYSYSWTPGGATTDTMTVNPTTVTTYTVTITDANNCSTTGTITINVNQLPAVSVTATAGTICNGNSDTLKASGAVNYTWSPATGLNSTSGSPVVANPSANVTYTVTGTDGNGCSNTSTTTVNVNQLPTVSLSGLTSPLCSNASAVDLTGVPPAPPPYGRYTGVSMTENGILQGVFHPDSAGVGGPDTITYIYKDSITGCINTASEVVTILGAPNVSVTPDSPAVCSGIAVTMVASGASSYTWSPSTGLSATTGSSVTSNTSNTTIYTVIGSDTDGCSSSISTTVTINALPIITIAPGNPNICLGNSITLNASGGTTYIWSPAAGLSCSTCSSTVASPSITTQYIVDANNGRCSSSDTITVGVYSVNVKAGPDQHILYGSTAQLTASGADFYTWTPANTLNNDSISDPIASPTATTTYTVTGRDSLGCTSTDTVVIYVTNPCESLMVPTGFTPAGTANRYFHVLNEGGASIQEFRVFNRWGEMVYETTDINDKGWDGSYNGKPQPMGTYVYYAELLCQGKTVFIKGNVTLLR